MYHQPAPASSRISNSSNSQLQLRRGGSPRTAGDGVLPAGVPPLAAASARVSLSRSCARGVAGAVVPAPPPEGDTVGAGVPADLPVAPATDEALAVAAALLPATGVSATLLAAGGCGVAGALGGTAGVALALAPAGAGLSPAAGRADPGVMIFASLTSPADEPGCVRCGLFCCSELKTSYPQELGWPRRRLPDGKYTDDGGQPGRQTGQAGPDATPSGSHAGYGSTPP